MSHVATAFTLGLGLLTTLLAACGDAGGGARDGGTDGGQPREVVGTIDVAEQRYVYVDTGPPMESLSAAVRATFFDGRPPRWHREVARAGACVLWRYTPSLCEPACTDGLCVEADVCEPWPARVAAGRLTITGLAVAIQLAGTDGFYYPDSALPPALFADDATVTADLAGGGGYPALTLTTTGVPAIRPVMPDGKLTLLAGQDFSLRWTPAGGASRVRLTLNSNNQGHGAPYLGIIDCDVDDAAGEVTVAAALIDGFPMTRAWAVCVGSDCPPSTLRRYHRAVVPVGERDVELVVASEVAFGVDHFLPD